MSLNCLAIVVALLVGLGLGWIYFGGLWLTIQQLPHIPQPIPLMMISFLLRLAIALVSVYLLINSFEGGQVVISLLTFSLGFLLMRNLLIIRFSPISRKTP